MKHVHSEPESTAVSPRGRGLRATLAVVSVLVLVACGAVANASAAITTHAGSPGLCGFSPKVAAAEDPFSSLTSASAMKDAMTSPTTFLSKLKAEFAAIGKEETVVENAAPSNLRGDFVTVFSVVNQIVAAIGKSGGNFMSLEALAPKFEADAKSASFKHAEAAIKAWFATQHCG